MTYFCTILDDRTCCSPDLSLFFSGQCSNEPPRVNHLLYFYICNNNVICHRPRLCTGSIPSTDQNLIVGSARVARSSVIKKIRILYDSLSTKDTVCRIVLCRALRKTIFCELCYDCATPIFKNVLLQGFRDLTASEVPLPPPLFVFD